MSLEAKWRVETVTSTSMKDHGATVVVTNIATGDKHRFDGPFARMEARAFMKDGTLPPPRCSVCGGDIEEDERHPQDVPGSVGLHSYCGYG